MTKKIQCKRPLTTDPTTGKRECPEKYKKRFLNKQGKICCGRGRPIRTMEKRPASGYTLFVKEMWAENKVAMKNMGFGAASSAIAAKWNELDFKQKESYKRTDEVFAWSDMRRDRIAEEGQCPKSRRFPPNTICKNTGLQASSVGSYSCCPIKKTPNPYNEFAKNMWAQNGTVYKQRLQDAYDKEGKFGGITGRRAEFGMIGKEIAAEWKRAKKNVNQSGSGRFFEWLGIEKKNKQVMNPARQSGGAMDLTEALRQLKAFSNKE